MKNEKVSITNVKDLDNILSVLDERSINYNIGDIVTTMKEITLLRGNLVINMVFNHNMLERIIIFKNVITVAENSDDEFYKFLRDVFAKYFGVNYDAKYIFDLDIMDIKNTIDYLASIGTITKDFPLDDNTGRLFGFTNDHHRICLTYHNSRIDMIDIIRTNYGVPFMQEPIGDELISTYINKFNS